MKYFFTRKYNAVDFHAAWMIGAFVSHQAWIAAAAAFVVGLLISVIGELRLEKATP